jgi:hypothetical protein
LVAPASTNLRAWASMSAVEPKAAYSRGWVLGRRASICGVGSGSKLIGISTP